MNRKKVGYWMLGIVGSILIVWGGFILFDVATYQETFFSGNDEIGNTVACITNGGYVAEKGDWIYYRNHGDSDYLYKVKKDGTGKTKIVDDCPFNINVIGDWIYYTNEYWYGHMYRIRTDGTERMKVNDDTTDFIMLKGDWIYFTSLGVDISGADYQLRKIKHTDTEQENLIELEQKRSQMMFKNFSKDAMYFVLKSRHAWLYKADLEGNDIEILNRDETLYANLVGEWIFYVNGSDENKLYKIKTDGSKKIKVSDDKAGSFDIKGDWIYYNNGNDNDKIYKVKLDGTGRTKVTDINYQGICIVGDWIYYQTDSYSTTYRVKLDGSANELVQ